MRTPSALALVAVLGALVGCAGPATAPATPTPVKVFQDDPGYQQLNELEATWYGTLKQTSAESYAVAYADTQQALYLSGEVKLGALVNQPVTVVGKLVREDGEALLWPAEVARHDNGLLTCRSEPQPPVAPEDKIASAYLADLITEGPATKVEQVIISLCRDFTLTPDANLDDLETLRASSYVMLKDELAPLVVRVKDVGWLTPSLTVDMELGKVLELAERADVVGLVSGKETAPPP